MKTHRTGEGCRAVEALHDACGFLGGEQDGVNADHWASTRIKRAHPSGSDVDHFTVIDCSLPSNSMIASDFDGRLTSRDQPSQHPAYGLKSKSHGYVECNYAPTQRAWCTTLQLHICAHVAHRDAEAMRDNSRLIKWDEPLSSMKD